MDHIDDDELEGASRDEQRDAMELWFRARFEDPAERTPYESREGGYIWIWGGPYEAEEELRGRFDGIVPDDVIEELASDLSGECAEWAPTPRPSDYDDEGLYEAVSSNVASARTLHDALKAIMELLAVQVPALHESAYRRLLFANVISALETYLSDTFINRVFNDADLLEKYIGSDPAFRDRKIPFKDVQKEAANLDATVRRELLDVVWHNVGKIKAMYGSVLGIDIGDLSEVAAAIQTRHDIVHRNGRQRDGQIVDISPKDVKDLVAAADALVDHIEEALHRSDATAEDSNTDF